MRPWASTVITQLVVEVIHSFHRSTLSYCCHCSWRIQAVSRSAGTTTSKVAEQTKTQDSSFRPRRCYPIAAFTAFTVRSHAPSIFFQRSAVDVSKYRLEPSSNFHSNLSLDGFILFNSVVGPRSVETPRTTRRIPKDTSSESSPPVNLLRGP